MILKRKWKFTFNLNVWVHLGCYRLLQTAISFPHSFCDYWKSTSLCYKDLGPSTQIWGPERGRVCSVSEGRVRTTGHQGIPPSQQPIIPTPERNSGFSRRAQILCIFLFSAKIICGPWKKREFLCSPFVRLTKYICIERERDWHGEGILWSVMRSNFGFWKFMNHSQHIPHSVPLSSLQKGTHTGHTSGPPPPHTESILHLLQSISNFIDKL